MNLPFQPEEVRVDDLPAALAEIDDEPAVHALQRVDTRKTAAAHYERRVDELRTSAGGPTTGEREVGYRTTTWAGMERYACLSCPYDTLEEGRIRTHVGRHRGP